MIQSMGRDTKGDSSSSEGFTRQGSLRRVLPSGHNKENLFGKQNEDLNKFYKQFHQEYVILAEYKMVQSEQIGGVYVIPSQESSLVWFGVLFVRTGPYEDGIFRFNIHLDEAFPNSAHPKVIFHSEVFHPVIDPQSNEVNLHAGFPIWQKSEQHIWQVLKYLQWMFDNVEATASHAVNREACDLLTKEAEFKARCKQSVQISREKLYERPPTDDKHYIVFEEYTPHIHDSVRATMLQPSAPVASAGHSWVKEGTFRPLTKEPSSSTDQES